MQMVKQVMNSENGLRTEYWQIEMDVITQTYQTDI